MEVTTGLLALAVVAYLQAAYRENWIMRDDIGFDPLSPLSVAASHAAFLKSKSSIQTFTGSSPHGVYRGD